MFRWFAAWSAIVVCVPAFAQDDNDNGNNWYFSWGYSRQQYADSSIHVSQPGQGNDFTVHDARASDYPTGLGSTIHSLFAFDFTGPQENVRFGRFLNAQKSFAIEFNYDHSKYNTRRGQRERVTGRINGQPVDQQMVLDQNTFDYALHNGLNHIMINGVWFFDLNDKSGASGDLQFISRVGVGVLLPHADNTIFGNHDEVGPKGKHICCGSGDWWQFNGWTTGIEEGLRYSITKSLYAELTEKVAYGKLHGVPVYEGHASQSILMSEQVLSLGFLF